jgi:hypothetical protein
VYDLSLPHPQLERGIPIAEVETPPGINPTTTPEKMVIRGLKPVQFRENLYQTSQKIGLVPEKRVLLLEHGLLWHTDEEPDLRTQLPGVHHLSIW